MDWVFIPGGQITNQYGARRVPPYEYGTSTVEVQAALINRGYVASWVLPEGTTLMGWAATLYIHPLPSEQDAYWDHPLARGRACVHVCVRACCLSCAVYGVAFRQAGSVI